MVGALIDTGVIGEISRAAADATGASCSGATMVLLFGSAVLSAIVDNIPYVATMSPIIADLVHADGTAQSTCCGGRWPWAPTWAATPPPSARRPTSSSSGIAERTGKPISFWEFTKYGLVVTVVTIALCDAYLWLRYFAFS